MAKGTKTLNSAISVDNGRRIFFKGNASEPADGLLSKGEMTFWIDAGAAELKVKIRNDAGVIINGTVASLAP